MTVQAVSSRGIGVSIGVTKGLAWGRLAGITNFYPYPGAPLPLPITNGDQFACELTFEHTGAEETVYPRMLLAVGGGYQTSEGTATKITNVNHSIWEKFTLQTNPATFSWYGDVTGECRLLAATFAIVGGDGKDRLVTAKAELYHTVVPIGAAAYRNLGISISSSRD
mgnify:CR=1 FL=1